MDEKRMMAVGPAVVVHVAGDSMTQLEANAINKARDFFGQAAVLVVDKGYTATDGLAFVERVGGKKPEPGARYYTQTGLVVRHVSSPKKHASAAEMTARRVRHFVRDIVEAVMRRPR